MKSPRKSLKLFAFNLIWQRCHDSTVYTNYRQSASKGRTTEKKGVRKWRPNAKCKRKTIDQISETEEDGEGREKAKVPKIAKNDH